MNKCKYYFLVVALVLLLPCMAFALPGAHDPTAGGNGYTCNSCHTSGATVGNLDANVGITRYSTNICLRCHATGGQSGNAKKNKFLTEDYANPFNNTAITRPSALQTSHKWFGSDNRPEAGATAPVDPAYNGLNKKNFPGTIFCARCHNVHGTSGADSNNSPYLRYPNNQDQLCLNCHRSRDTTNHTLGTHPVNVSYTSASVKAKIVSGVFLANPVSNTVNPTGQVKLVESKIVCSTCHGVHNTDSRTSTFDRYTTFGQLSSSKGYLLRVDARGKAANDVNICTNCHAGKVAHNANSQNIQCNDCHGAHVEYDASAPAELKNVYLIRRFNTYSAPGGGFDNKRVLFRYTSASKREYYNYPAKTGVCQNCHNLTSAHFSGGVEANGLVRVACASCHKHNDPVSSFKASGCDGCHGFPPVTDTVGGPNGKASALYTGTESTAPHSSHASGGAGNYTFGCNQCHNGYDTAPSKHQDGIYNDGVFVTKVAVSAGNVIAGATATYNGTTCLTVYCHSDGTSTTTLGAAKIVTWAGGLNTITGCAACHAASPITGSHTKHVTTMGYGCVTCHAGTVTNNTTVNIAGGLHVNGLKDVQFSGSGAATGTTCSNVACHSTTPVTLPVWGTPATGACGSCHLTAASAPALATGSHTKHFTLIGGVDPAIICIKCHTYNGETSAPHVDGFVNVTTGCNTCHLDPYSASSAAAPAWGSTPGCAACHTVASGGAITATGPATGSHVKHNNADCSKCHATATTSATAPTSNHADGNINVSDGYPPTVTKHTFNTGYTGTCSTASCHANPYVVGGTVTTPVWGVTSGCDSCHTVASGGAITAKGPATGSHVKHNNTDCSKCHLTATTFSTAPTSNHADGNINVSDGYPATVTKHTFNTGYTGTCSTASCHANPYVVGGTVPTPVWGNGATGCSACHTVAIGVNGPVTGGHTAHAGTTCISCHNAGTTATSAPATNHADGSINVTNGYPVTTKHTANTGYTGTCTTSLCHGSSSPVWGPSTTNNLCTKCHGTPTVGTVDGTNLFVVAPIGGALTGTGLVSNNIKVGAHETHLKFLNGFSNYSTLDYRCKACHGTLPTLGTHAGGSSTPQGSFQNLATKWSAMTPAPTYTGASYTCNNTYCHNPAGTGGTLQAANAGTAVAPVWTNATYLGNKTTDAKSTGSCSACHKVPGDVSFASTYNHGTVVIANDCASCHGHNGDVAGALGKRHLDGKLYGAGNCNSCHDYDTVGATYTTKWSGGTWGKSGTNYGAYPLVAEGWGAHAVHINYIKTRLNITVALDPVGQTFGAGNPANICGSCHTNAIANHNMNGSTGDAAGRMIDFGGGTFKIGGATGTSFTFGTTFPAQNPIYNSTSGTTSGTLGKTCSNLSCHYFTTPLWSTY